MGKPHRKSLVRDYLLETIGRYNPVGAGWIVDQSGNGPDRASLKVSPAVRARTIRETFDAVRTPGALKCANVSLGRWRNIAVATFAIRADLKHPVTLPSRPSGPQATVVGGAYRKRILYRTLRSPSAFCAGINQSGGRPLVRSTGPIGFSP